MPLPFEFDYKNPDYIAILDWRKERLEQLRADKTGELLTALRVHYKNNPAQFIIDWGMTSDPRNPGKGLPAVIPFLLFPKQEEWINESLDCWIKQEPFMVVKTREMGVTWLAVALSVTLCIFYPGLTIGFASRKEILVDHLGDPDCIFYKIRQFMSLLPAEFRGTWDEKKHSPYMRCLFPDSGSTIKGEAGRDIGRGGRTAISFVDEAASLAHAEEIEASLSQTTSSRQDISTPRGMGNVFARKFKSGNIRTMVMHWSDDPRKDNEWYQRQCKFLDDPVLVAQELDCDFTASLEGMLIRPEWINAAIDAHIALGIEATGIKRGGLDVADQGRDKNAQASVQGILIYRMDLWSGQNSDIMQTTERSMEIADEENYGVVAYDADGLGAGVRGDARTINVRRAKAGLQPIIFNPFHGSAGVLNPKDELFRRNLYDPTDKMRSVKNEDFFYNFKAQAIWAIRRKFMMTYRAVIEKKEYNYEDIIAISSKVRHLHQLKTELSQYTGTWRDDGKLVVDKMPDGALSPNLADALIIACAPQNARKGFYDVS